MVATYQDRVLGSLSLVPPSSSGSHPSDSAQLLSARFPEDFFFSSAFAFLNKKENYKVGWASCVQ